MNLASLTEVYVFLKYVGICKMVDQYMFVSKSLSLITIRRGDNFSLFFVHIVNHQNQIPE